MVDDVNSSNLLFRKFQALMPFEHYPLQIRFNLGAIGARKAFQETVVRIQTKVQHPIIPALIAKFVAYEM
jgi:hypothetical protein